VAAKAAELAIRIEEDQYVSRLLLADGTCFGAVAFDLLTGEPTVHLADAVILATGGLPPHHAAHRA
jgi:succinate dehydrogenase / fumarate reductase flavoprotein subunit